MFSVCYYTINSCTYLSLQVLRQLIQKCLQEAEKDKFTSIAIPAIGTGNLQFPREEVAKVFFEEVSSYLMIHPQSTIKDVRFVVYSGVQATLDAFLGMYKIWVYCTFPGI
jgi:poly [ADP-ribose] polymerase 10/14/15